MYLRILEHETGEVLLHRDLRCEPEYSLQAVDPYRDLVTGNLRHFERIPDLRLNRILADSRAND